MIFLIIITICVTADSYKPTLVFNGMLFLQLFFTKLKVSTVYINTIL